MRYKKFAATAIIAVAATAVAAGTAGAAPAPVVQSQAAQTVQGQEQGVGYAVQVVDKTIVAALTDGAFSLDADQKNVSVKNTAGAVVTQIPLAAMVGEQLVPIAATIDEAGQKLTLTPDTKDLKVDPVAAQQFAQDISSQQWFFAELQRASLGALIGGIIGFFFVGIGAIPGALIGLLIAGGPNLINAGIAYFSGQP
ncbi:DUF6861 domain-containing protein [Nocardia sp. NPDC127579]|uniref:DUF6861 domain-containing protein n=1 Tax=Nocardia sp. NPDC127579 TaxID=3345402 RepID=UPI003643F802